MKMRSFRFALSVLLLATAVTLCQHIIIISLDTQEKKADFAEINHIKYGLFSINKWKEQIVDIIRVEVSRINFSKTNEAQVKKHLEMQLNKMIDVVHEKIREKNELSAKGRIKQAFINIFVDIKTIKEGIPHYADSILQNMKRPEVRRNMRNLLLEKVETYFDSTFEEQNRGQVYRILLKTGAGDVESASKKLKSEILANQLLISQESWLLILLAISLFAISVISKKHLPREQYVLMAAMLSTLLFSGILTPMIDLEAKISEMSFVLFDHPVKFINQVLYFQSKSIFDVFALMMAHPDLQMKAVGLLMVVFSIVFPFLKIASSAFFYFGKPKTRDNSLVRFFLFKSGKWSMADVMVISIFMAYIGFNGILQSQLSKLQPGQDEVTLLTTNGTSLQPGFFLFLAFTILSLVLSEILIRKVAPAGGTVQRKDSSQALA